MILSRPAALAVLITTFVLSPCLAQTNTTANLESEIERAVVAAPSAMRAAATAMGYNSDGGLYLLRQGTNDLTCVGDKPGDDRFQSVCYHNSLETFMNRGRELRAEGMEGKETLRARHEEADAGTLAMPDQPAILYNLIVDLDELDLATATPSLYAIYTPYATEASTGLSTRPPAPGAPWIMRGGTASAHIMIVPPGKDH